MSEVIKFISSSHFSDADPEVKTKLLNHLANKLNSGTAQRSDMDQDAPYSYQKDSNPEKSVRMTNRISVDTDNLSISDLSNDSNNNLQTVNDNSAQFLSNIHQQKSISPTPTIPSPVFTSYKPIQPVPESVQQQGNVPTVPLTILVPANLCSATFGTTCVIPLNLPTASPQQLCQGNIIQTIPQSPPANFAITSNPSISLIQAPNLIQSAQSQNKAVELSNVSPQNNVYTFTPTVLSEYNRTPTQAPQGTPERSKSTSVPFTMTLNSPEQYGQSKKLNLDFPADSTKETAITFKTSKNLNELSFNSASKNSETCSQHVRDGNQKCAQTNTSNFTFRSASIANDKHQNIRIPEYTDLYKRIERTEQGAFSEINKLSVQPDNRSPIFNRNHDNICDNTPDMWRPWNASV